MKLRHKILTISLLLFIFLVVPVVSTGALWIQHVGLLPSTSVVFSNDAAAIDKFMATALKSYYGDRIGICDGVADDVEIQAALDVLPATGGTASLFDGTHNIAVQITVPANSALIGCGFNTIIKVAADITHPIFTNNSYVIIANLQLDGNKSNFTTSRLVHLSAADHCLVYNVYVHDASDTSIFLRAGHHNLVSNCIVIDTGTVASGGTGILLWEENDSIVTDCVIENADGELVEINPGTATADRNLLSNLWCKTSGTFGIALYGVNQCRVEGCHIEDAYGEGIEVRGNGNMIEGNVAKNNRRSGIELYTAQHNVVVGNVAVNNGQGETGDYQQGGIVLFGPDATHKCMNNVVVGNRCYDDQVTKTQRQGIAEVNSPTYANYNLIEGNNCIGNSVTPIVLSGYCTIAKNNYGGSSLEEREVRRMKNTSGGNLTAGAVVTIKSVAAGNEVETSNVQGSDKIFGMLCEDIDNNADGCVLVLGKTTILRATNTDGNIAIGDFLCQSSVVEEAGLAGAGDMAFAIALEACAAVDCSIDALLITPRKL